MNLIDRKQRLLQQRLSRAGLRTTEPSRAVDRPRREEHDGPLALSSAQRRMWYHAQLVAGSAAYNFCLVLKADPANASLSKDRIVAALGAVARRHDILRTLYTSTALGAPEQVVEPDLGPRITEVELGAASDGMAGLDERLDLLAREARDEPFDLENDAPLRAILVRHGSDVFAMVLVLPHIAGDGGSFGTVLTDIQRAYGHAAGTDALPPPSDIRYADYARWEARRLGGPGDPDSLHARQLRFWAERLAASPVELRLPLDRPRPAVPSFAGRQVRCWLGPGLATALRHTVKSHGATPLVALQAAVAAALDRVGAGRDVPLGVPVDLRQDSVLDQVVGFFSNTVVVRADLSGDPSFSDLLRRIHATMLAALDHRDVPFESVVEHINPPRHGARNPLFGVMVTATRPWPSLRLDDVFVSLEEPSQTQARFDLTFVIHDEGGDGRIGVSLLYACDLFDEGTARHLLALTIGILGQCAHHPRLRLSQFAELGHRPLDEACTDLADALTAHDGAPAITARAIRLRDDVGATDIVAALAGLLERHDALRLRRDPEDGRWKVADAAELWERPLLRPAATDADDADGLVAWMGTRAGDGADDAAPMLELRAPGTWIDAESWGVLLAELSPLRRGTGPAAPRSGGSYSDWLRETARLAADGDIAERAEAWLDVFDAAAERTSDGRHGRSGQFRAAECGVSLPDIGPWPDPLALRTAAVGALIWALRPTLPLLVEIDEPDRDRMRSGTGDAVVGRCRRRFPFVAAWPQGTAPDDGHGALNAEALLEAARAALTLGPDVLAGAAATSYLLARDVSPDVAGVLDHVPAPDLTLSLVVTDPGDGIAVQAAIDLEREGWTVRIEPRSRRATLVLHAQRPAAELDAVVAAWSAAFPGLVSAACVDVRPDEERGHALVPLSRREHRRLEEDFGPIWDVLPLSPLQEGLRFHAVGASEGAREVYISQTSLDVRGRIDVERLRRAAQRAVELTPTVTAGFTEVGGTMVQVVPAGLAVPWRFEEAPRPDRAARIADQEYEARFDAARPPLIRFALLRLSQEGQPGAYRLLLTAHHILLDGWSIRLLFRLVFRLYGDPDAVSAPPPFRRYLDWLGRQDEAEAEEVWRGLLAGLKPTLLYPGGRILEARAEQTGERKVLVDREATAALAQLARSASTTVSTVLELAWGILLMRLSGETDVAFGNVVSGRPAEIDGVDEIIGLLFNTIPTRVSVGAGDSVHDGLRALHRRKAASLRHSHVTLTRLHELAGHSPLFDTLFSVQNLPAMDLAADDGIRLADARVRDATHYPLSMAVTPTPANIDLRLMFRSDLITPKHAEALIAAYVRILEAFVRRPEVPLLTVDALPDGDALLPASISGATFDVGTLSVSDLLVRQADATPEARAVVAGGTELSFAELAAASHRLAHLLQACGVAPEHRVALLLPRSEVMIVALFAVFAAHAAYVPIDLATPANRILSILEQSRPTVILTVRSLQGSLPEGFGGDARVVVLDDPDVEQSLLRRPGTPPDVRRPAGLHHLAYVIFTSGSTGAPKGVAVPYLGLTNMFLNHQEAIFAPTLSAQNGRRLKIAHTTSFAFDASWEQLLWLLSGHEVHVVDDDTRRDPDLLLRMFDREEIDAFDVTPTYGKYLVEHGLLDRERPRGRPGTGVVFISLGGEAVGDALWTRLREAPGVGAYNLYGPTEYTINALGADLADSAEPSVGRPIANTSAHILGPGLLPAPVGVTGELYLGGVGLAREYVGRSAATAERFVANPFGPPGSRLYRTGDLARWRPDGGIDFLGRSDDQLKIRGHRIEPAEVENALVASPGVRRAAVLGRPAQDGSLRLVAYVVCDAETADAEKIRDLLRSRLPSYMVPAAIVFVDDLPRTINGKLDVAALPHPAATETGSARPVNAEERVICAAFASVLERESVGRFDDFFECGGHSLLTVRLVGLLRDTLGGGIGIRLVYDHPTPAALAAFLSTVVERPETSTAALSDDERDIGVMLEDVALPPDLPWPPVGANAHPALKTLKSVLLTGAAGFLGSYILVELLRETSATIHILVRAEDETSAVDRVRKALTSYGMWDDSFEERLVGVPGDLARQNLGLSAERFETLAETCDVIVHNGGATNEAEPYARLAATNVGGAKEVLRLSALGRRATPVHFVSTASVVSRRGANPAVIGEQIRLQAHEVEPSGYVQSKWVAEELMHSAADRGLPITIYRPGRVSGHSVTGACGGGVGFWYFIRSMLLLQAAPELRSDRLTLAPVDYVARALVALMERGQPRATYHLSNRMQTSVSAIRDAAREMGYRLKAEPFDVWHQRLLQTEAEHAKRGDDALTPVLLLAEHIKKYDGPAGESALGQENVIRALAGSGIAPPPVDPLMLRRYIRYFIDVGFFPPPADRIDSISFTADSGAG